MHKILFTLIFLSTYALAGRDGNGGNDIALRFTQVAVQSLEYLSREGKNPYKVDLALLEKAINDTKVFAVTHKLCADDNDKKCPNEAGYVAKNYPDKEEILVNEKRWENLPIDEQIRIVMHEYLGIIKVEAATYNISSNIVIALSAKPGNQYSCQLTLIKTSYPSRVLGSTSFITLNSGVQSQTASSPIKDSIDDVVFRVVSAEDYLRGTVEISEIDRDLHFVYAKKKKKIIFENEVFFNGEPLGIKVFQKGDLLLQVSCIHITTSFDSVNFEPY